MNKFFLFIKSEPKKVIATVIVAIVFLFFWVNGPLLDTPEILSVEHEASEYGEPVMVGGDGVNKKNNLAAYQTLSFEEEQHFGYGLILDKEREIKTYGMIANATTTPSLSKEIAGKIVEHAEIYAPAQSKVVLKPSLDMYYAEIIGLDGKSIYLESTGLVRNIRGYAGEIKIGVILSVEGNLKAVKHISSKETASYLADIQKSGFYDQFEKVNVAGGLQQIDAVSGATLTSKAIAGTVSELISLGTPYPIVNYADIDEVNYFSLEAILSKIWILHIAVIGFMFLFAVQKWIKKSKKTVLIMSLLSAIYIGFFLNNSFTYISFVHPFIGTSVSSLVGLYSLMVLIGAIWGKNTYCKYVCPFGNVQRLIIKVNPYKTSRKFFLSNKWVKRIRAALTVIILAGVLLGLRNWSNFELFPDLFGWSTLSVWTIVAVLTVLTTMVYPMIWCRLLCPTGSILDGITEWTDPKKKIINFKKKTSAKKVAAIIAVMISGTAWSQQSSIEVIDHQSKEGIPNAHIVYQLVAGGKANMVLTSFEGKAVIKGNSEEVYQVEISFLGYKTLHEKIVVGKDYKFVLETDNVTLNSLVVTGQYTENSPEKAVQKVTIITSEKIEKMAAVNLKDVLSNELNIRLSQDNVLGAGMSLQGMSGENVKILIDGVPMIGRLDGNIDLSQINMNNVERIEIIEGPMSVNYGTNALAGVINIITKKQQKELLQVGLNSFSESVGNYNLDGRIAYSFGKHGVSVSGGRNYFDGWKDGDQIFTEGPRVADSSRYKTWNPKEQVFGRMAYQYQTKSGTLGYQLSGFNEVIKNRGYPKAPYGETAFDDYYLTKRIDQSINIDQNIKENKFNTIIAYNYYQRIKSTYFKDLTTLEQVLTQNSGDQDTSVYQQGVLRSSWASARDSVKVNYQVGIDFNLETGDGARIENQHQELGDYAVYGSFEYKPFKQTIVRPGVRWAYNTAYSAPVTPSINLKQSWGKFNIRVSYARGFRAPSLKELYFNFVDINHDITGNTGLGAENSHNYNASVNYTTTKNNHLFKWEFSGFYNKIFDMITLAQTSLNSASYTYVNIDHFETNGVQMNVSEAYKHIKMTVGGSYIGRYNQLQDQGYEVPKYNYTPEVRANVSYEFPKYKIYWAAFYKYTGPLPVFTVGDGNSIAQQTIEGYHMADITLGKSLFQEKLQIVVGSKNIFDVKNINAAGASSSVHGGSATNIIGMGRTYFVQLKFNLNHEPIKK